MEIAQNSNKTAVGSNDMTKCNRTINGDKGQHVKYIFHIYTTINLTVLTQIIEIFITFRTLSTFHIHFQIQNSGDWMADTRKGPKFYVCMKKTGLSVRHC